MPSERSDVRFPMWRKKMDASMFVEKSTYVPDWVIDDLWQIRDLFTSSSKKNPQSEVDIEYRNPGSKSSLHGGWVTTTKYDGKRNDVMRFYFDDDVKSLLERDFEMTYLRMLEKVSRGWNSPKAESEIPFWEFIDIEFDEEEFTFIMTPHYNLDESMVARFPEIGGGGHSAESNIDIDSEASPDEYDSSPPPDASNFQDSKEMAIEKMGLSKGSSIMRFQWFVMPDGRKIHIKYSKWYDGDNHQYFWYGVTPKSLMIAHERGVECFGFIAGKEGCVVVDLETLLEYVTEAQVSTNKEDISVIRHYHLFINREMRVIHNRTDERTFESEFVPFG